MTQTTIKNTESGGPETRRQATAARLLNSSTERGLESMALGVGAIAFVVAALVALIVFRFQSTPISGPGSIGEYDLRC